jgi:hypothetical protein
MSELVDYTYIIKNEFRYTNKNKPDFNIISVFVTNNDMTQIYSSGAKGFIEMPVTLPITSNDLFPIVSIKDGKTILSYKNVRFILITDTNPDYPIGTVINVDKPIGILSLNLDRIIYQLNDKNTPLDTVNYLTNFLSNFINNSIYTGVICCNESLSQNIDSDYKKYICSDLNTINGIPSSKCDNFMINGCANQLKNMTTLNKKDYTYYCKCLDENMFDNTNEKIAYQSIYEGMKKILPGYSKSCIQDCGYKTREMLNSNCPDICFNNIVIDKGEYSKIDLNNVNLTVNCGLSGKNGIFLNFNKPTPPIPPIPPIPPTPIPPTPPAPSPNKDNNKLRNILIICGVLMFLLIIVFFLVYKKMA